MKYKLTEKIEEDKFLYKITEVTSIQGNSFDVNSILKPSPLSMVVDNIIRLNDVSKLLNTVNNELQTEIKELKSVLESFKNCTCGNAMLSSCSEESIENIVNYTKQLHSCT